MSELNAPRPGIVRRKIFAVSGTGKSRVGEDSITVEEPLQIVLRSGDKEKDLAVVMRTPVMDYELAAGFLFTEGIIHERKEILSLGWGRTTGKESRNVVVVTLPDETPLEFESRNFFMNSSCGVCGKSNINEIYLRGGTVLRPSRKISRTLIGSLPGKLKEHQSIFTETGGIHAAGLFDFDGNFIAVAEDVGRHNAVDKIAGFMLLNGIMGRGEYILQVSGRAGFEIVQKAVSAGISVVSSVSAPSSLAMETAETFGVTLICFVRGDRFNIYAHEERLDS